MSLAGVVMSKKCNLEYLMFKLKESSSLTSHFVINVTRNTHIPLTVYYVKRFKC